MSLFAGLFGFKTPGSGLFSEASKFKSHHRQEEPDEEPATSTGQLEDRPESKKGKWAAKRAPAGSKEGTAAEDAAALKLQAGIAAAKAVQEAADDTATALEPLGKRQKRDKQDKHSKKARKTAADSSPAAGSQHQQDEQPQEQQAVDGKVHKKHKRHKSSTVQTDTQPQAAAAAEAPEQQQNGAAEDAAAANSPAAPQQRKLSPEEEAEKLSRTVFVGNLPVSIKRKQLIRLFSTYGEVDSVRLRSVPLDLESKKKLPRKAAVIKGVVSSDRGGTNAYVVFKEAAAATAALAANMTEVDGHHIRVDRAAPPSAAAAAADGAGAGSSSNVLYDPVRSVFVGNLDFKVTEEELIRTFSNGEIQPELAAAVEAVRVVRDPKTNLGKGIAYVLFKTKAAARTALQLDGQKLGKRAMRVSRVDKKASAAVSGNKNRSPSAAAGGAKRLQDKHSQGAGSGVKHGGVQKFAGTHSKKGYSSGTAAADWQGLRTKGKGSGFRSAGKITKPLGERQGRSPGGSKGQTGGSKSGCKGGAASNRVRGKAGSKGPGSSKAGGKRPAVAARKEKAKVAAKRAKAGK